MAMDSDFEEIAAALLEEGRWAVELPAGAGKTQLICYAIKYASAIGYRTLVLTHTNAGVSAIERRCRSLQLDSSFYCVRTISAWCELIAVSYRDKSELPFEAERQDPGYFARCVQGASSILGLAALRVALGATYDVLLVDEYQDCNMDQHNLIMLLATVIRSTVVLGDRLQRIFDFKGEVFPDWEADVLGAFPLFEGIEPRPYRWQNTNPELGEWLLGEVRPTLIRGEKLHFDSVAFQGFGYMGLSADKKKVGDIARRIARCDGSSLVICPNLPLTRIDNTAKQLAGAFHQMEEIEGKFMRCRLADFDSLTRSEDKAVWLAGYAKDCFSGLPKVLDNPVLKAMRRNESLEKFASTKGRAGFGPVLQALESASALFDAHSLQAVKDALKATPKARLVRQEAWTDALDAIAATLSNDDESVEALRIIRERRKHFSSRAEGKSISKPLLVKGLEYDNVMVLHAGSGYTRENLYVALTRATCNLVVFS